MISSLTRVPRVRNSDVPHSNAILTGHIIALPRLAGAELQAQSRAGTDFLTGRVTDYNGKPIADAQVGATSLQSGLRRTSTTDVDGRFRIYFPETAPQYALQVKRMGFSPVQRTIIRRTKEPEQMTVDMQLGGAPLALSMVEITGSTDVPLVRERKPQAPADATVPNPVAEILALKDTLHLSAIQIVALTDVADSLHKKNSNLYKQIQQLVAKSQEAGDVNQMAGTIAMMLQEASTNTQRAVGQAEKLLQPEQWSILPQVIRDCRPSATRRPDSTSSSFPRFSLSPHAGSIADAIAAPTNLRVWCFHQTVTFPGSSATHGATARTSSGVTSVRCSKMCPADRESAIPILGVVALGSSNTTTTLSAIPATLARDGALP